MRVVRDRLLTPVGLRSLAPGDPDYKARYFGDLRARDAAYHQGTVWALAGRAVRRRLAEGVSRTICDGARRALEGFVPHLDEACIGSISEVFDAEAPFTPRGCIAQAWSVAEVLRAVCKLGYGCGPALQRFVHVVCSARSGGTWATFSATSTRSIGTPVWRPRP